MEEWTPHMEEIGQDIEVMGAQKTAESTGAGVENWLRTVELPGTDPDKEMKMNQSKYLEEITQRTLRNDRGISWNETDDKLNQTQPKRRKTSKNSTICG